MYIPYRNPRLHPIDIVSYPYNMIAAVTMAKRMVCIIIVPIIVVAVAVVVAVLDEEKVRITIAYYIPCYNNWNGEKSSKHASGFIVFRSLKPTQNRNPKRMMIFLLNIRPHSNFQTFVQRRRRKK